MAEPARLTPNQRERRHRILEATRELVARHGYDGTIMRDIAVLANVSPTTLYNLYNTKDELLLAALREKMTDNWQRAEAETGGPGLAYLLRTLEHSVAQTRESPAYSAAIAQALFRAGTGDALVDILLRGSNNPVHRSLEAMRDRGELVPTTDTLKLATLLIGTFWSGYLMWGKGAIPLDQLEDYLKRSYLSVLLPVSRGDALVEVRERLSSLDN